MQLANDPIMKKRSIQSFRHLECQNLSIISESIGIPNGSKKMGKKVRSRNLIHIEEDFSVYSQMHSFGPECTLQPVSQVQVSS